MDPTDDEHVLDIQSERVDRGRLIRLCQSTILNGSKIGRRETVRGAVGAFEVGDIGVVGLRA